MLICSFEAEGRHNQFAQMLKDPRFKRSFKFLRTAGKAEKNEKRKLNVKMKAPRKADKNEEGKLNVKMKDKERTLVSSLQTVQELERSL